MSNYQNGYVWDEEEALVGEVGYNTFKCSYIPEDTDNYNIVTDIDITIKVIEKLVVNIEKYIPKASENEEYIYIKGIETNNLLKNVIEKIETNGKVSMYNANEEKIVDYNEKVKTGMKLKIQTEIEKVEYILVVKGDNNGDRRN